MKFAQLFLEHVTRNPELHVDDTHPPCNCTGEQNVFTAQSDI